MLILERAARVQALFHLCQIVLSLFPLVNVEKGPERVSIFRVAQQVRILAVGFFRHISRVSGADPVGVLPAAFPEGICKAGKDLYPGQGFETRQGGGTGFFTDPFQQMNGRG